MNRGGRFDPARRVQYQTLPDPRPRSTSFEEHPEIEDCRRTPENRIIRAPSRQHTLTVTEHDHRHRRRGGSFSKPLSSPGIFPAPPLASKSLLSDDDCGDVAHSVERTTINFAMLRCRSLGACRPAPRRTDLYRSWQCRRIYVGPNVPIPFETPSLCTNVIPMHLSAMRDHVQPRQHVNVHTSERVNYLPCVRRSGSSDRLRLSTPERRKLGGRLSPSPVRGFLLMHILRCTPKGINKRLFDD